VRYPPGEEYLRGLVIHRPNILSSNCKLHIPIGLRGLNAKRTSAVGQDLTVWVPDYLVTVCPGWKDWSQGEYELQWQRQEPTDGVGNLPHLRVTQMLGMHIPIGLRGLNAKRTSAVGQDLTVWVPDYLVIEVAREVATTTRAISPRGRVPARTRHSSTKRRVLRPWYTGIRMNPGVVTSTSIMFDAVIRSSGSATGALFFPPGEEYLRGLVIHRPNDGCFALGD
jgi:hypothetical protein